MKVVSNNNLLVAKFKDLDLIPKLLDLNFEVFDFKPESAEHKKLKFITCVDNLTQKTSNNSVKREGFTLFDLLKHQSDIRCGFFSIERKNSDGSVMKVSNGELRRWITNNSVSLNGFISNEPEEIVDFFVNSLILFPNNIEKKNTLI